MAEELDPISGLTDDGNGPDLLKEFEQNSDMAQGSKTGATFVAPVEGLVDDSFEKLNVGKSQADQKAVQLDFGFEEVQRQIEMADLKNQARLADEQGVFGEIKGAVVQAAGEIVGGTVEGFGYLFDFENWYNVLTGQEADWQNWMTETGESLKEWTREIAPIYENPLDPSTREWFFAGVPTVASFASIAIPATGAAGALSKLGLLGKSAKAASKGAKGLKTALKSGDAVDLAKTISIGGEKVKGLTTAVISRHIEGMMEAHGVFEEEKMKLIQNGMSMEDAEKIAGDAAMKVYQADWAMLAQDFPQYMMLGRAMNATRGIKSLRQARAIGEKGLITKTLGEKGKDLFMSGITEGFEEAYQFIASQEAMYFTDLENGLVADSAWQDRYAEYVKDDEFFDSVFFGALGGVAMTASGGAMAKAGDKINDITRNALGIKEREGKPSKDTKTEDPVVKEQKSRASRISFMSNHLQNAADLGDTEAYNTIRNQHLAMMAAEASSVGNFERMYKEIEQLQEMTPEQIEKAQVSKEFVAEVPSILQDLKEYEQLWNATARSTASYAQGLMASMVGSKFMIKKLTAQMPQMERAVAQAELTFPIMDLLTTTGAEHLSNQHDIAAIEKFIKGQEYIVNNQKNLSKDEKEQIQKSIENAKEDLQEKKDNLETKEYKEFLKDLSKKDKQILKEMENSNAADEIIKAKSKIHWADLTISKHLTNLARLSNTEYLQEVNDSYKKRRKEDQKVRNLKAAYNVINDGRHPELDRELSLIEKVALLDEAQKVHNELTPLDKDRYEPIIEEMKSIIDGERSIIQRQNKEQVRRAKISKRAKDRAAIKKAEKARAEELKALGDPRFMGLTPSQVFTAATDALPAMFQGKEGIVSIEDGSLLFTDKAGNEHIVSGHHSESTLEELGVGIINDNIYDLDLTMEGDNLSIWINGHQFFFNTATPIEAISETKGGNLASVTLLNAKGQEVIFNDEILKYELADVIYLYQMNFDEFVANPENTIIETPYGLFEVEYNMANPMESRVLDERGILVTDKDAKRNIVNAVSQKFNNSVLKPMMGETVKNEKNEKPTTQSDQQSEGPGVEEKTIINESKTESEVPTRLEEEVAPLYEAEPDYVNMEPAMPEYEAPEYVAPEYSEELPDVPADVEFIDESDIDFGDEETVTELEESGTKTIEELHLESLKKDLAVEEGEFGNPVRAEEIRNQIATLESKAYTEAEVETPVTEKPIVSLSPKELELDEFNNLILDENGEAAYTDDAFKPNLNLLSNPNVKAGHKVRIFVDGSNSYWQGLKDSVKPEEVANEIPMYVEALNPSTGEYEVIGKLKGRGRHTEARKFIYEQSLKGNKVEATLKAQNLDKGVFAKNASNLRQGGKMQSLDIALETMWVPKGESFELQKNAPLFIITTKGSIHHGLTIPELDLDNLPGKIKNNLNASNLLDMKGYQSGQVWVAMVNPSGVFIPVKVSTSNLTSEAIDRVMELMLQNSKESIQEINKIVHVNTIEDTAEINKETFVRLGRNEKAGTNFIKFFHKGNLISVEVADLAKAMESGEHVTAKILEMKDGKLSVNSQKGSIAINGENALREFLGNKKFHVDKNFLGKNSEFTSAVTGKTYPNYEAYLAGRDAADGSPNTEHSTSILQSDLKGDNGNFFFDVGAEFELGKPQVEKTTTTKTESTTDATDLFDTSADFDTSTEETDDNEEDYNDAFGADEYNPTDC